MEDDTNGRAWGDGSEGGITLLMQVRESVNSYGTEITRDKRTPVQKLPTVVLIVMKVACVFHYSNMTGERMCYNCKRDKRRHANVGSNEDSLLRTGLDPMGQWYRDQDKTLTRYERLYIEEDAEPVRNCALCDSFWWNYDGDVGRYNDKIIGVAPWNHTGSWFFSLAVMFGALLFLAWDFLFYVHDLWGDPTHIIHIFNYGEFILIVAMYPVCNLCSKITEISSTDPWLGLSWTTAINARFILKRLQYIGFNQKGIPGKVLLAICYGSPLIISCLRGFLYVTQAGGFTLHSGLSVICTCIIMIIGGNFIYLLYLMRLSFQRQFYLINQYLAAHHRSDLDNSRRILGNAIQDFNCFRKFVGIYLFVYFPVITWSITTQVVWKYMVQDALCPGQDDPNVNMIVFYVTAISWANILFSLILVIWSVGGFDISYVIDDVRRRMTTTRGIMEYHKNWQRLIEFFDGVSSVPRYGVKATTLFSVIGFYMALRLGQDQAISYFEHIGCEENLLQPTAKAY